MKFALCRLRWHRRWVWVREASRRPSRRADVERGVMSHRLTIGASAYTASSGTAKHVRRSGGIDRRSYSPNQLRAWLDAHRAPEVPSGAASTLTKRIREAALK